MSKPAKGKMDGASHAEVFNVVDLKQRDQVVKIVKKEEVSLGMVDPTTGRLVIVPVASGKMIVWALLDVRGEIDALD